MDCAASGSAPQQVLWRRITMRLSLIGDGDELSYGYHRHSCPTNVGCGYTRQRKPSFVGAIEPPVTG